MNSITYILAAILLIIVLCNLRKIGAFIYGVTVYPWELLFDGTGSSTGNGAGLFGPLIGFVLILAQLAVATGIIVGIIVWKLCH